jgi:hypothetical protein
VESHEQRSKNIIQEARIKNGKHLYIRETLFEKNHVQSYQGKESFEEDHRGVTTDVIVRGGIWGENHRRAQEKGSSSRAERVAFRGDFMGKGRQGGPSGGNHRKLMGKGSTRRAQGRQ